MAGLFGFFNFEKPGLGVDKGAPKKKRFFQFFELFGRKFWKLMQLNLLFILLCVPVVTIGPAVCGFTYVLRNLSWEKPIFLVSDFFDAFKRNFKQGLIVGILDLFGAVLLFIAVPFYYANMESPAVANYHFIYIIFFAVSLLIAVIYLFMHYYVYLMVVSVNLNIRHILKNSFILTIVGMKTNLLTTFFLALVFLVPLLLLPYSAILFFILVPAIAGFIMCFNSFPYILKYVGEPYYKQHEEALEQIENTSENAEENTEEDDKPIFTDIGTKEEVQKSVPGKKGKKIR